MPAALVQTGLGLPGKRLVGLGLAGLAQGEVRRDVGPMKGVVGRLDKTSAPDVPVLVMEPSRRAWVVFSLGTSPRNPMSWRGWAKRHVPELGHQDGGGSELEAA